MWKHYSKPKAGVEVLTANAIEEYRVAWIDVDGRWHDSNHEDEIVDDVFAWDYIISDIDEWGGYGWVMARERKPEENIAVFTADPSLGRMGVNGILNGDWIYECTESMYWMYPPALDTDW